MIIDWLILEKEIDKIYKRGKSVDVFVMRTKALLIGVWYGLSDERVKDDVHGHIVLSRFRTELTKKTNIDRQKRNTVKRSYRYRQRAGKQMITAIYRK
jgi:hypothetical protein